MDVKDKPKLAPVGVARIDQTTTKEADQPAPLQAGMAPSSRDNVLEGARRNPTAQTSGLHVRMQAMMGKLQTFDTMVQDAVGALVTDLGAVFDGLAALLVGPQPVLVGAHDGRPIRMRETDPVEGPPILMMASIRDMLRGAGRLAREVPGQWIDKDYSEVCAAAKKGDRSAKKAKKIAEQRERLSQKTKGKK